ncbi:alpha-(1,3)-fucosyltransferase 10-like isoform X1 [Haliotis rufescens]|uniref:alpha-(1,3)-fucosyltransferase 10-like isoform X1 n=2 Tax=Haliotis rufescens TaxID=6454 RepID=UPI00201E7C9F|nr:alpha-(1,3)-fucosyltransferase 10-like isoform X1 [Haliotis rufescens]
MFRPDLLVLFILLGSCYVTIKGHIVSYTVDESHADLPVVTWWETIGEYSDYVISCEAEQRCVVSRNKTAPPRQQVKMYLFYGSLFLSSGLPLPRKDGDLWALVHEESPKNNEWLFSFESTMELFNYTATFQRGSDYPFPTHWLTNLDALLSKEYLVPTHKKNLLRTEGGLAPIIFVHSDCHTPSNREQYIKLLQKYVDVDSYGSCLHNKDFPEELKDVDGMGGYMKEDFFKLIARYKFAIAFENAICDDYITEKLWRPLQVGAVPIVLGSPTIRDFLPSNKSAILVEDFASVAELAEFIKHLDRNDEQYESYRQFKHTGISNPTLKSEVSRLPHAQFAGETFVKAVIGYECFICDKLHKALDATRSGGPLPKAQSNQKHLDCPLPSVKYDENGKTVHDPLRDREVAFYKTNAEVFRQSYEVGENITAHDLYLATTQRWKDADVHKDEL